jgi:outer membrane protein assembly factor BamE (lipoprotein component of BamABCDE complex)
VKTSRLCWAAPVLFLLVSNQLFAQSNVDERVQKLEETVRVLESRVASLENQLSEQTSPAPISTDSANWRKLKRGMSERDVEKLLGSPTKVDASSTIETVWYYGSPVRGSVRFYAHSGKVIAWRQP